jgi:pimeloyl-ACP methyl ester carboxylesterase
MPQLELSAGPLDYEDTGNSGSPVVMLHGFMMDSAVWRGVVSELRGEHRCVVPTLPLGAHRKAMRPDADLHPRAVARIAGELIERLGLAPAAVVGNDTGGTLAQFLAAERPDLVDRLVLTSCDAFDNFPPGLPGKTVAFAARVPGGLLGALAPLRVRPLRRLPFAFGWMAKRPIPAAVMDAWFRPCLTDRAVRRDATRFLRNVDKRDTLQVAEQLQGFDRPALIVWAAEDRVMPPEHGRRLAEVLPNARLVEVEDSFTLIPEDQPAVLAHHLREFLSSD